MSTLFNRSDNHMGNMSAYDLIQFLNEQYPPRCIGLEQSETSAQRYAGKRDVVESLLAKLKTEER